MAKKTWVGEVLPGLVRAHAQVEFVGTQFLTAAAGIPAVKPPRPIQQRFPISNKLVAEQREASLELKTSALAIQSTNLAEAQNPDAKATATILDTGWYPADCALAVGPKDLVAAVNGGLEIFKKNGTALVRKDLTAFFGAVTGGLSAFDPRAVFDPHSNRFIVVAVARGTPAAKQSLLLVAVSQTSEAASGFDVYAIDVAEQHPDLGTLWADFPTLGVDARGVYIGLNMFPWVEGFAWARLLALDKSQLLNKVVKVFNFSDLKDPDGTESFTLFPCRTFGDPLSEYLVSSQVLPNKQLRKLVLWQVNWDAAFTPSLSARFVSVKAYSWPPTATQPDGSSLASGDIRIGDAVFRAGAVYCTFTTTARGRSAIQWAQITAATGKVMQQGVLADSALSLAYSSLQPNSNGDLALLFTATGSALPASIALARRVASDPLGSFGKLVIHTKGKASQTGKQGRWGDYTGMAADPADGKAVWGHAPTTETPAQWKAIVLKA